jgi:hypothetical protein
VSDPGSARPGIARASSEGPELSGHQPGSQGCAPRIPMEAMDESARSQAEPGLVATPVPDRTRSTSRPRPVGATGHALVSRTSRCFRPARTERSAATRSSNVLTKHAAAAAERCRLTGAKKVTPDMLRPIAAMRRLHAPVDTTVIALWLGHERVENTQIHLYADLAIKEQALARTAPVNGGPSRYRPPTRCWLPGGTANFTLRRGQCSGA